MNKPTIYTIKHSIPKTLTKKLLTELIEIGVESTSQVLVLYLAYISMSINNQSLEDDVLADLLGITTGAIKKRRLKLTKAGYFLKIKGSTSKFKTINYFIGKEAVSTYN